MMETRTCALVQPKEDYHVWQILLAFVTVAALALLTLAVSDSQAKPANGSVIRDQAARLTTQQVGYTNNVGQYRQYCVGKRCI